MSTHPLHAGLAEVRRNWGWFLLLGVCLLVLGTFAIAAAGIATLASILLFGWLLIIGGIFQTIAALGASRWSGFSLHLLAGILNVVVGILIIGHPLASAAGLTLLLAVLFLVGGLFRILAAITIRHPNWGWEMLGGVITALLGVVIWAEWPSSALWVIGTFVGIDLIFRGWAWVMFALAVRRFPQATDTPM